MKKLIFTMLVVLCTVTAYRYPAVETANGAEPPIESSSRAKWEGLGIVRFIFINKYGKTYQEGQLYVKEIQGKTYYRIEYHKKFYLITLGKFSYEGEEYNARFMGSGGTGFINI